MKWFHDLHACFHKTTEEVSLIWSLSSCLCCQLGLQQESGAGTDLDGLSVEPVWVGGCRSDRLRRGRYTGRPLVLGEGAWLSLRSQSSL